MHPPPMRELRASTMAQRRTEEERAAEAARFRALREQQRQEAAAAAAARAARAPLPARAAEGRAPHRRLPRVGVYGACNADDEEARARLRDPDVRAAYGIPHTSGPCNIRCTECGAFHWQVSCGIGGGVTHDRYIMRTTLFALRRRKRTTDGGHSRCAATTGALCAPTLRRGQPTMTRRSYAAWTSGTTARTSGRTTPCSKWRRPPPSRPCSRAACSRCAARLRDSPPTSLPH